MRKEIFIAVVLGLMLGLVVTYGVYTANKAISQKQKGAAVNTGNIIPTPTSEAEPSLTLTVSSPDDGIVVSEPELTVEGTTLPEAVVTILTENDEVITQADSNGVFQEKVTLTKGANTIEVTATDLSTTSLTKSLQLVYSTEVDTIKQD